MNGIGKARWQAASPLLDELLEADEAQRRERLAQVRRSNPSLADDVAALLAQQAAVETAEFLEGSALPPPEPATLAGQTLGNYTLERPIGQGGMSSVWLASRSDGRFEGRVAVKFLNLALLARGAERFTREGSMLARLSHPNIARLLDAGVAAGTVAHGQPYLVLEYIDGTPIDAYCDAHELGIDARLRLFLGVLAAVAHAHNNLILHRDLKPSNILVTHDGQVKLLDFGIGKLLAEHDAGAAATELTQFAGRAFTPDYAAPEQFLGEDVTTATDVYSLGVLLYQLLVGRHPTALPTRTPLERQRAVIETEATRASDAAAGLEAAGAQARSASAQRLARALRGDLDNIVAKALKKRAADRYPTAAAFAEDLRRYLDHEPVGARADSLAYRAGKFVRRHRIAVGAAAAVVLALVAGIAGTAWQGAAASRARDVAQENAAKAEFEARVARANHEFVSQLFGDAMGSAESGLMQARLDRAREVLRRRFADDPVVHALLLLQVAGRYAELSDAAREADVMREVTSLSERSGEASLQAAVACIRAYDLLVARNVNAARPLVADGLRLMSSTARPLSAAGFECHRADAMLATASGDPAAGVARMQQVLAQMEREGLRRTRGYLSMLASLGFIHRMGDDPVSALAVNRRARALNEMLGSEYTVASQNDLQRESDTLFELGRLEDAVAVDRELLNRFRKMDGAGAVPDNFALQPAQHAIAAGNAAAAIGVLRRAQPRYERDGPETHARGVTLDLAAAYLDAGRPADASAQLRRYEARLSRGPGSAREKIHAAQLGTEMAMVSRKPEALRRAVESLEAALAADGLRRLTILRALLVAGRARLALGEPASALVHARRAAEMAAHKQLPGQGNAWVGAAETLLAAIALVQDDVVNARRHLANASQQFADSIAPEHRLRREVALLHARL